MVIHKFMGICHLFLKRFNISCGLHCIIHENKTTQAGSITRIYVIMHLPFFLLLLFYLKYRNHFTLHGIYCCVLKLPQDLTTLNNTYIFYILRKCHQVIMIGSRYNLLGTYMVNSLNNIEFKKFIINRCGFKKIIIWIL